MLQIIILYKHPAIFLPFTAIAAKTTLLLERGIRPKLAALPAPLLFDLCAACCE
jgi:hypothetical protein